MKIRRCVMLFSAMFFYVAVAGAVPQDWEESAQFDIRLNGNIDLSARIYQPMSYSPHMILMSENFSSPLLIDLGKKRVYLVSRKGMLESEGFLKTTGIPSGKKGVSYTMKDGATVFTIEGKRVAIKMRPPLIGEVSPKVILAHSPDYQLRMKAYTPKQNSISKLQAYGKDTEVVIMFATWCSTCKTVLPKVMKVLEQASNAHLNATYYGIAMGGEEPHAALERHGHDYPAVIVYQGGKELGRIVGDPPGAMEDAILGLLR